MYARGILFGKMKYELGDHSFVRCPELDLVADLDFKTKGWVGGTYNAIGGCIKRESTDEILYELSGLWSDEMYIKDVRTGHKEMFFNARTSKHSDPLVRPIEEQEERESQRLWQTTVQAVKDKDHERATDEKTKIEDRQRAEREARSQEGVEWKPRLFRRVQGGPGGLDEGEEDLEWIINAKIDDTTPEKQEEQIKAIYPVVAGQKSSSKHAIPPHNPSTPAAEHPPKVPGGDDLINFSGSDNQGTTPAQPAAAEPTPVAPAPAEAVKERSDSKDIQGMLSRTGTMAPEGPLMDFTGDLKKSVPSMQRADTSGDDEFHDAKQ